MKMSATSPSSQAASKRLFLQSRLRSSWGAPAAPAGPSGVVFPVRIASLIPLFLPSLVHALGTQREPAANARDAPHSVARGEQAEACPQQNSQRDDPPPQ